MEAFDTIRYKLRKFRGFVLVVAGMDFAIVTEKKPTFLQIWKIENGCL
ncbi:hypothetical protein [Bacillus toyonensis]|nr:hypothetical protein [Bacillus toyonensis]